MLNERVFYHHFPGHEHHHESEHGGGEPEVSKEEMIKLLEYLVKHNAEHKDELKGYRDKIDDPETAGLISQSLLFMDKANGKLNDAIAAYKRSK